MRLFVYLNFKPRLQNYWLYTKLFTVQNTNDKDKESLNYESSKKNPPRSNLSSNHLD